MKDGSERCENGLDGPGGAQQCDRRQTSIWGTMTADVPRWASKGGDRKVIGVLGVGP